MKLSALFILLTLSATSGERPRGVPANAVNVFAPFGEGGIRPKQLKRAKVVQKSPASPEGAPPATSTRAAPPPHKPSHLAPIRSDTVLQRQIEKLRRTPQKEAAPSGTSDERPNPFASVKLRRVEPRAAASPTKEEATEGAGSRFGVKLKPLPRRGN